MRLNQLLVLGGLRDAGLYSSAEGLRQTRNDASPRGDTPFWLRLPYAMIRQNFCTFPRRNCSGAAKKPCSGGTLGELLMGICCCMQVSRGVAMSQPPGPCLHTERQSTSRPKSRALALSRPRPIRPWEDVF
eukprot:897836-Pleurochrysis_carterae.AAC.2